MPAGGFIGSGRTRPSAASLASICMAAFLSPPALDAGAHERYQANSYSGADRQPEALVRGGDEDRLGVAWGSRCADDMTGNGDAGEIGRRIREGIDFSRQSNHGGGQQPPVKLLSFAWQVPDPEQPARQDSHCCSSSQHQPEQWKAERLAGGDRKRFENRASVVSPAYGSIAQLHAAGCQKKARRRLGARLNGAKVKSRAGLLTSGVDIQPGECQTDADQNACQEGKNNSAIIKKAMIPKGVLLNDSSSRNSVTSAKLFQCLYLGAVGIRVAGVEGLKQRGNNTLVLQLPQCFDRCNACVPAGAVNRVRFFEDGEERLDGLLIAQLAQRLRRIPAHVPVRVMQRGNERVQCALIAKTAQRYSCI